MTLNLETERRAVLALAAGGVLVPLMPSVAAAQRVRSDKSPDSRNIPFGDGWLFRRGEGSGYERSDMDDGEWRKVTIPHDWSIEDVPGGRAPEQLGPFDRNAIGRRSTGFTVGGEGWYRKHFRLDAASAGKRVEILFGGAYLETDLWLNGKFIGRNVHGYIPFAHDLTPFLNRDSDNVIAVRVRNNGRNSRWYAGSGLYRDVTLDILPMDTRLSRWGVAAWTRRFASGRAIIDVSTQIESATARTEVVSRLVAADGAVASEVRSAASRGAMVKQQLSLRGPKLWSPDQPHLYRLESELLVDGRIVDRVSQLFGVRIVSFDPKLGMRLNGKVTKLRGGNLHHDNGLLGACAYRDADERRIRLLKARGFNAVRSSHNPAGPSLRDACDRLGMLLIEEAFDAWHVAKEPDDYSVSFPEHWRVAIEAMVKSARNSPSVIMWSIGNEIPDRATDAGVRWSWTIAQAVKQLDSTRPVTAGIHGILGSEMVAGPGTARPGRAGKIDNASTIFIDVPGYNYRLVEMQREFAPHPERITYASETFPKDMFDYSAIAAARPNFLGEFVWTATDYLGEAGLAASGHVKEGASPPTRGAWPWVNAWCGDIDLVGHQKPQSLARDVAWGVSNLEIAVQRPVPAGMREWVSAWGWSDELQSWNWAGHEGRPLTVRIYSSGDRVDVLVNGTLISSATMPNEDAMRAEIKVPYSEGAVEAVAYRAGKEIARRRIETTGVASALRLVADTASTGRGEGGLRFVRVEVVDAQGRVVPAEAREIRLSVEGPASLLAFGNADPLAEGSVQSPSARTFDGRALAVARVADGPGVGRMTAVTAGLRTATILL